MALAEANDEAALDDSIVAMNALVPSGGSNLSSAFEAIAKLDPMPDNIFLLTDGLPTQGDRPCVAATLTVKVAFGFAEALEKLTLPFQSTSFCCQWRETPWPSSFWRLAQMTGGRSYRRRRIGMRPRKDRNIEVSLSFLDVISCGFGAVILLLVLTRVLIRSRLIRASLILMATLRSCRRNWSN